MKKVLIISTSLREGGNSEVLAEEFAKGAKSVADNSVEVVTLRDKSLSFCIGCLTCQKTKKCVIKDDASDIVAKMLTADVLVFATPIYFYEMSGQMKTLLDRTNPNFIQDYAYRDIYLIATAAEADESAMDGAIKGLRGWTDCFENTKIAGVLYGVGVTDVGDVEAQKDLLKQAFDLGVQA